MFDMSRTVEEFPVLVRFDFLVPTDAGDGVTTREKRIADHVAPTGFTDTFVFASMHPV